MNETDIMYSNFEYNKKNPIKTLILAYNEEYIMNILNGKKIK